MKLFIISVIFLTLAFVGIAIKILLKKNGKFAGTCAGNSEFLQKEGGACGICGAKPEEQCKNEE